MNKFKLYFLLFTLSISFFSCEKDNPTAPLVPPRDFAEQYRTDFKNIEDYLKENCIEEVTNSPGNANDQDITFAKVSSGKPSLISLLNAPTYPKLLVRKVNLSGVDYEIYYLVLRPGVGESPCNVDEVLASYKGSYLSKTAATATAASEIAATFFEESRFPKSGFNLREVILGWGEIFPQFKAGTSSVIDGKVSFSNFGAGVMFLPSALAYYNSGTNKIPAYAPLIFSFKLYEIKRIDTDGDGIPSHFEGLDKDGYLYDYRNTVLYPTTPNSKPGDTENDGIPDFLDIDDDGDGITTFDEIKRPNKIINKVSVSNGIYPYNGAVDDLSTEFIDESEGIPAFINGKLDYKTAGRKRVHIDKDYPIKK